MSFSYAVILMAGAIGLWLFGLLNRSDPRRDELMGNPRPRKLEPPRQADAKPPAEMTLEMRAELRRLIETGNLIGAIKLVRAHGGLGLKEAKDIVDRLKR